MKRRIDHLVVWELVMRALGGAVAFVTLHFALRFAGKSLFLEWPYPALDRWAPLVAVCFGVLFAIVWSWLGRAWDADKVHFILQYITRFSVAPIVLLYGVGKVQGSQFYPSFPSTLDSTISELDGASLTWAYFGRSYPYALFVAGGQILAALLLLSRRTQLFGAALLAVIFGNIAFINFAYDIGPIVKVISTAILVAAVYLVLVDAGRLKALLWSAKPHPFRRGWLFVAIHVLVIVLWLVPDRVRGQGRIDQFLHSETALHGLWDVTARPGELASVSRVYFDDTYTPWAATTEHDRMRRIGAVRGDHSFDVLEYWVEPQGGLEMKLPAGTFRGRFTLDGDTLRLTGTLDAMPVAITLHRAKLRAMTRQSTP
jgi:hypothetical protein